MDLLPAAVRGEIPPGTLRDLAVLLDTSEQLVRTVLQQPSTRRRPSFVAEAVIRAQARDVLRYVEPWHGRRIQAFVRTQPTCPLVGVRKQWQGKATFVLDPALPTGTFDTPYLMYRDSRVPQQSVALSGSVKALTGDRLRVEQDPFWAERLSEIQRTSLWRPSAAMFQHAGGVSRALSAELGPEDRAAPWIFLKGRPEGRGQSAWLANSTMRRAIVDEPGYTMAGRACFPDDDLLVVEAEGDDPAAPGLEQRHRYVTREGQVLANAFVRAELAESHFYKLDDCHMAECGDVLLVLLAGNWEAEVPGAEPDRGQALLVIKQGLPVVCYSILPRSDRSPAIQGSPEAVDAQLKDLARVFNMLEGEGSTAGMTRREQFGSLERFDVPMSDPSGRENVWTIASATRQASLPGDLVGTFAPG